MDGRKGRWGRWEERRGRGRKSEKAGITEFWQLQNLGDDYMDIHYGELVHMFEVFPATLLGG